MVDKAPHGTPDTAVRSIVPGIVNDGPRIVYTDYWTSSLARGGMCFLSGNAGHWRFLIPRTFSEAIGAFRMARSATIEASLMMPGHVDIVAEDGTSAPFAVAIDPGLIDRAMAPTRCRLFVYTDGGLVRKLPLSVRRFSMPEERTG